MKKRRWTDMTLECRGSSRRASLILWQTSWFSCQSWDLVFNQGE
jgi:hypothetical protein